MSKRKPGAIEIRDDRCRAVKTVLTAYDPGQLGSALDTTESGSSPDTTGDLRRVVISNLTLTSHE
jgi:hypothetical protein